MSGGYGEPQGRPLRINLSFITCAVLLAFSGAASAGNRTLDICSNQFQITAAGETHIVPYCSSHSIESANSSIERVIVTIHSSNFDAVMAFTNAQRAISKMKGGRQNTLIFAPQFIKKNRLNRPVDFPLLLWAVDPFWGSSNGLGYAHNKSVRISAYEVLEEMLEKISDPATFPNVKSIILVGHSAGGQMINRFAAGNTFEESVAKPRDIHIRYVVMNPSSYVYFDNERSMSGGGFAVPSKEQVDGCKGYNNYGYGLDNLYSYHRKMKMSAGRILREYPSRNVIYLVGAEDNKMDGSLSMNCAAVLQGENRLQRARTYFNHLIKIFGSGVTSTQRLEIVPGVGHSGRRMLSSEAGLRYLMD